MLSAFGQVLFDFAMSADGKIVSVHDVENGSNCNCYCAGCGSELIAKQGKIKQWHFSHKSIGDCSGESFAHVMAKQMIVEGLFYPSVEQTGGYLPSGGIVKITSEKSYADFVPDITVEYHCGKLMFIEIAVTHYVDEIKRAKLFTAGVDTLEISLQPPRGFAGRVFNQCDFIQLLSDSECEWIYNQSKLNYEQEIIALREKERLDIEQSMRKTTSEGLEFIRANFPDIRKVGRPVRKSDIPW